MQLGVVNQEVCKTGEHENVHIRILFTRVGWF